ncbi:NADP-dependent oxidoreductase [Poritiphilus flavus]|uniref:NADP-dependent oxidoreductase n=1 Tax=Poritiphilus flavus TaxID=2697053 RepID=UPI001EEC1F6A|nr:NADP-dependent oxidoreductase [Poritiphilus flavus]
MRQAEQVKEKTSHKIDLMNKRVLLAKRPKGMPDASTWQLEELPVPGLREGEALIQTEYISLDPAMRGWIRDAKSYLPPVKLGEVMRAAIVGKVIASKNRNMKVGDYYTGFHSAQLFVVTDGNGMFRIDSNKAPLTTYLSVLGMPGITAYFGLLRIGQPKAGETVLVSGAAGAVGSVVGQIAKIKGCHVVGIAGGTEKCDYIVNELGFDGAIDYKNEDITERLDVLCPNGIDVYYDNVGGEILDTALTRINRKARIVICGAISQYNKKPKGPDNYYLILAARAKMEGFVVIDYFGESETARLEMGQWMREGRLRSREFIAEGIENFHEAFLRLFSGKKMGKLILKVA